MRPLLWSDPRTIDSLDVILRNDELVLAEGDTVLGLLANISHSGFERLNGIKSRSKKPYLILVSDYKKVLNLIDVPFEKKLHIEKLANKCWPGPVTLIFYAKADLAPFVTADNGTIAVRIPSHDGLLALLRRFDGLFSTSANLAGQPVPSCLDLVDQSILDSVGAIVCNDRVVQEGPTLASTIIDCTRDNLVVVRQGVFSLDNLTHILD